MDSKGPDKAPSRAFSFGKEESSLRCWWGQDYELGAEAALS